MATNRYVDSNTGNNADTGATQALSWATFEKAVETGALAADYDVWVRRTHIEFAGNPISDIVPAYSGTPKQPIRVIGWPRDNHAIASSDWTNGSTGVVVDDADMSRTKHQGRFVTAPDGFDYLITRVVDASNIVIDREYAGATVANSAATIKKDENFDTRPADVDGWDADADDLPCVDWKNQNFQLRFQDKLWWVFKNFEMRDSLDANGLVYFNDVGVTGFQGCLFYTDQNKNLFYISNWSNVIFKRSIIEGNGVGASQDGVYIKVSSLAFYDSAIYNLGRRGISQQASEVYLENVNIGVEVANQGTEFYVDMHNRIWGRDVRLGGTNGYFGLYYCQHLKASFENYGKILGAHKEFTSQGEITKLLADGAGDAPNQRPGGAANVVEILYDLSNTTNNLPEPIQDWTPEVYKEPINADTSSQDYRIYVQSMADLTAIQLWIECEYVSGYDDAGEYVFTIVKSDETITTRADADDWTQYIEVTGIQPAAVSKVRLKVKCAYMHAANKIFLDAKRP